MTPERWQRVKGIFQAALDLPPGERSAFLSKACDGDEHLRGEVESLLAAHEKDGSFIDSPAHQAAAGLFADDEGGLRSGQIISHYEILSTLGEGGMGKVYLAQDKRLGRRIALKLLPASYSNDLVRLRRFEQEARATSALNHPNILTIHEIGEASGRRFIAAEYVEGETLRDRLASGSLEIEDALHVSEQIASALAAAQTEGIIHRDIKPDNIMLRRDAIVKVLDFGLAKLAEDKATGPDDPTRALVKTGAGVVMGTAQYMSPEQARGQEVDGRTDIFSLGVVIYEMVTGSPLFKGDTASDVIASILKTDPPPLSRAVANVPAELERIVGKCLEKDRDERYQTVKDLLLDLRKHRQRISFEAEQARSQQGTAADGATTNVDLIATNTAEANTSTLPPARTVSSAEYIVSEIKRHKTGVVFVVAGLIIAAVAGIVALYKFMNRNQSQAVAAPQILRTTQISFSPGLDVFPSLSPDGNSIAYSSDQNGHFEIYVKQLTPGGREIQLTSDGKENGQPEWSPDGQRIAFHSKGRGGIWIMPALGGSARQITEFGSRPAWSHDGSMLAFQSGSGSEIHNSRALAPSTIWTVSSQGDTPKQITQTAIPPGGHNSPAWSPDGKRIAFASSQYLGSTTWIVAIDGGNLKQVSFGESPVYAPDGKSLYLAKEGLSAVTISATGNPVGAPVEVIPAAPGASLNQFTISADGKKIAYTATRNASGLWSLAIAPGAGDPLGSPVSFAQDTSNRSNSPQFSKDGRKVAMTKWRQGSVDLWIADADGRNLTQLTTHPSIDTNASWFPNADRIAFLSYRENQRSELWSISLATGKEERLLDIGENLDFAALSPDGTQVAFNSTKNGTINLWTAKVPDGQPRQLTFDKELMGFPCWSPDGQWLAFEMKRGDDNYLAIMPSAGGELIQIVSEPGLSWPHSWSADGDKIAFAGRRNGIWNIYWVSRSTKQQKQLTNYSKLNAFVRYPAWSPLGNQIVYEYNETTGNIWLMELK
jgi:eukaryotic-like serine/threonine-protein kinase